LPSPGQPRVLLIDLNTAGRRPTQQFDFAQTFLATFERNTLEGWIPMRAAKPYKNAPMVIYPSMPEWSCERSSRERRARQGRPGNDATLLYRLSFLLAMPNKFFCGRSGPMVAVLSGEPVTGKAVRVGSRVQLD